MGDQPGAQQKNYILYITLQALLVIAFIIQTYICIYFHYVYNLYTFILFYILHLFSKNYEDHGRNYKVQYDTL